jgi:threonine dehydrogenase-like Zn-dependent dehydrogenase
MTDDSRAMVLTAPAVLELQRFQLPTIGPDDGLLRVERCGICGSDLEQVASGAYTTTTRSPFPVIPGHEPVGVIESIGDRASERWGVSVGDRVIVEPIVACGDCTMCAVGRQDNCLNRRDYGFISTDESPSLWGGYAEYLYLSPSSWLHRIPPEMPLDVAATYNAVTNGLHWGVESVGLQPGQSIAVLGAGQRGLGCVVAAAAIGASDILVTGLSTDRHKLDVALKVGATATVDIEREDLVARVEELTDGRGVDVVLDLAPSAPQTLVQAVNIVRPGGTIVVAGIKSGKPVTDFCTDNVVMKSITIKGVLSNPHASYEHAIELMAANPKPLEKLHTHTFSLEDAEEALRTLGGQVRSAEAICVCLAPNG